MGRMNIRGMREGIYWGYGRVSTKEQHEDRQIWALTKYGIPEDRIYFDKQSGKDFNRPEYKRLIRDVNAGDIIVIKSIDRLGRNYQDIMDQWRMITQDIGCGIHVIDMPALNTSGDPHDLISKFITDMMLQVLSFVAENERTNILQRQKEGIAAAKRRGVKFGREGKKIPKEFFEMYIRWKTKSEPIMNLVRESKEKYDISMRTFYRRIGELDRRFGKLPIPVIMNMTFDEDIPYVMEEEMAKQGVFYNYNNYVYNPEYRAEKQKLWAANRKRKKEAKEIAQKEELKWERAVRIKRENTNP